MLIEKPAEKVSAPDPETSCSTDGFAASEASPRRKTTLENSPPPIPALAAACLNVASCAAVILTAGWIAQILSFAFQAASAAAICPSSSPSARRSVRAITRSPAGAMWTPSIVAL